MPEKGDQENCPVCGDKWMDTANGPECQNCGYLMNKKGK